MEVPTSQTCQGFNRNMAAAQRDAGQVNLPGWRIEQKYSKKVLIGNWAEERKEFKRSSQTTTKSCQRIDFIPFPDSKPDTILRRSIMKRLEGLPKQHLLTHHGEVNSRNLVSQYDDHFLRHGNSSLPPIRSWDGQNQGWAPERSDYPIIEPPTNFGLIQQKSQDWRRNPSEDPRSVYMASYRKPPSSALAFPRYAVAPRILSSNMYLPSSLQKNLGFRTQRYLQGPHHGTKIITHTPLVDIAS